MTIQEYMERLSLTELVYWRAFYELEQEDEKAAVDAATEKAKRDTSH
jgi:hypothetical protein